MSRYDLGMLSSTVLRIAAIFVVMLCGCANSAAQGQQGPERSRETAATTSPESRMGAPSRPDETERVEEAYQRFWVVAMEVDKQRPSRWRETLSTVAAEPLLTDLLDGFKAQHAKGLVEYGKVVSRPTVVDLQPDRASIMDCQDASASGELDVESGAPKTIGSSRTAVAAVLRRDVHRGWRVVQLRYLEGPC